MNINHTDIKPLEREITVTVETGDYNPKVQAELKKLSNEVAFRGFRKGKVPMSYLKKMHGQAVLSQKVYEILEENLNDYIHAHEMRIIGQPLVSKNQEEFQFDINEKRDYTFIFDVGLAPELDLKGFDKESSYERYDVAITDDVVTEELDNLRKQLGEQVDADKDINDNDIVELDGKELENGEVKKKGWTTTFTVHVGSLNEEVQKELIGKDKGFTFQRDIYDLAKEGSESFVRKHYLFIDEDEEVEVGNDFELKVKNIKRLEPAELNEEFFEKAFGEEASNEEDARELLRKEIKKVFDRQADAILSHTMRDELMEQNEIELPREFLKRWLTQKEEEDGVSLSDEELEDFMKNMRWSLITSEIRDSHKLEVSEEEIVHAISHEVSDQFRGYQLPPEFMQQFIENMAKDKAKVQEIADKILGDKIVTTFKENVTIVDKPVSIDEFNEISRAAVEKLNAENAVDEEE